MVMTCVVCGITSRVQQVFKFPHPVGRRQSWLDACGVEAASAADGVCTAHFRDTDVRTTLGRVYLPRTAIPVIQNSAGLRHTDRHLVAMDNAANLSKKQVVSSSSKVVKSSADDLASYQKQAAHAKSNPKLLLPFKHGWRRELVLRATSGSRRCSADAYYYTPGGAKLRSIIQVQRFLAETRSDLSTESFSFTRRAVGAGPLHEVVRRAGESGATSSPRAPVEQATTAPPATSAPAAAAQLATRKTAQRRSPMGAIILGKASSVIQMPATAPSSFSSASSSLRRHSLMDKCRRDFARKALELKRKAPVFQSRVRARKARLAAQAARSGRPSTEERVRVRRPWRLASVSDTGALLALLTPDLATAVEYHRLVRDGARVHTASDVRVGRRRLARPCSLFCFSDSLPLALPSAQCLVCRCLSHPVCVGLPPDCASFVCVDCYKCVDSGGGFDELGDRVPERSNSVDGDSDAESVASVEEFIPPQTVALDYNASAAVAKPIVPWDTGTTVPPSLSKWEEPATLVPPGSPWEDALVPPPPWSQEESPFSSLWSAFDGTSDIIPDASTIEADQRRSRVAVISSAASQWRGSSNVLRPLRGRGSRGPRGARTPQLAYMGRNTDSSHVQQSTRGRGLDRVYASAMKKPPVQSTSVKLVLAAGERSHSHSSGDYSSTPYVRHVAQVMLNTPPAPPLLRAPGAVVSAACRMSPTASGAANSVTSPTARVASSPGSAGVRPSFSPAHPSVPGVRASSSPAAATVRGARSPAFPAARGPMIRSVRQSFLPSSPQTVAPGGSGSPQPPVKRRSWM